MEKALIDTSQTFPFVALWFHWNELYLSRLAAHSNKGFGYRAGAFYPNGAHNMQHHQDWPPFFDTMAPWEFRTPRFTRFSATRNMPRARLSLTLAARAYPIHRVFPTRLGVYWKSDRFRVASLSSSPRPGRYSAHRGLLNG